MSHRVVRLRLRRALFEVVHAWDGHRPRLAAEAPEKRRVISRMFQNVFCIRIRIRLPGEVAEHDLRPLGVGGDGEDVPGHGADQAELLLEGAGAGLLRRKKIEFTAR